MGFLKKNPETSVVISKDTSWVLFDLEAWLLPLWMSSGCEEGGQVLWAQVDAVKAWGTAATGSHKSSCPTLEFQVHEEERSSP